LGDQLFMLYSCGKAWLVICGAGIIGALIWNVTIDISSLSGPSLSPVQLTDDELHLSHISH